jgi:microcystin degradation protein MlrC
MKKRIFVAGMHQESNSFTALSSERKDFTTWWEGEELLSKMAGIRELKDAGYEIVPAVYAGACPGGILKLEDFRKMAEAILEKLPLDGSIDGVFFPSHGALEVEFIGSGDTFLISMIRERVGCRVPIAAALDLHANNTFTLSRITNIIYGYRTAPHIDVEETRIRTAKLLIRALEEKQEPWTEMIRLPFMIPGENMMTDSGFGREIMERLPELEQTPGIWCASFFAGIPWVDCAYGGCALVISGVGEKRPGLLAAKKFAAEIWERRKEFVFQGSSMEPEKALMTLDGCGTYPAILSDSADNVTAGASGDNGYMLKLIQKKGVKGVLYAGFIDPKAVAFMAEHREGNYEITLGRVFDPKSEQVTFREARTKEIFEKDGKAVAAVLETEGITVLIFALRGPMTSREVLESYHLNLDDYRILVVKQGYLTPALYKEAKAYIMALTPGNCAQDLKLLTYHKIRRPMEPLEAVTEEKRILETYEPIEIG